MARTPTASTPHFRRIAEIVKKRILDGDYAIKAIPSERQLATEFGVNYMTVRRGLQLVMAEGLLTRQSNGRMRVRKAAQGGKPIRQVAYLAPLSDSFNKDLWRAAIEAAAQDHACSIRTISYMRWSDSLLIDAIEGFDAVFLCPGIEPIPEDVVDRLRASEYPVIVVDLDFTEFGLPSIQNFPPSCVHILLRHLASLGCRNIFCLNTQPEIPIIQQRIEQWRFWIAAHRCEGSLVSEPAAVGQSAADQARSVMDRLLREDRLKVDGMVCTTAPTGMGAMRALLDHGVQPGRDIKVCAVNGEGIAHLLNPTMTALESPNLKPFLDYCFDWITSGKRAWHGPLLLQPAEIPLIVGRSTVP